LSTLSYQLGSKGCDDPFHEDVIARASFFMPSAPYGC
jgi:hypothetical protein